MGFASDSGNVAYSCISRTMRKHYSQVNLLTCTPYSYVPMHVVLYAKQGTPERKDYG